MDFKSRRWGDSPTPKARLDKAVSGVPLITMPSEKTKKLLEGLGKITDSAPNRFEEKRFHSYTNMYYTSIPESIHKLPKRYDKAKRKKDDDGDEYIMIDRIYGSIFKTATDNGQRLLQADGTYYQGKLHSKRRLITHKNNMNEKISFYSRCTVTADGRWFDNSGMPIEAPDKLEPEKQKSPEDIAEEKRRAAEKEARILANLK